MACRLNFISLLPRQREQAAMISGFAGRPKLLSFAPI